MHLSIDLTGEAIATINTERLNWNAEVRLFFGKIFFVANMCPSLGLDES